MLFVVAIPIEKSTRASEDLTGYSLGTILFTVKDERSVFRELLNILDQVSAKMESMHSAPLDYGTGVPLYRTEIHTIRAIGENPGINVTNLAEHMGVTKGAVSQTITKLARKRLVRKTYAEDNVKEVLLELTELGLTGYHGHEQFHMEMFDMVREYFGDELKPKIEMFITAMTDVNGILAKYEQRGKDG